MFLIVESIECYPIRAGQQDLRGSRCVYCEGLRYSLVFRVRGEAATEYVFANAACRTPRDPL